MTRPIRILVIEDSEDDAKLAMRALKQGGFSPSYHRVQSVDALTAALAQERWDAVLSDFRMPGFSGVEALEIFRSSGFDMPFIFLSGTIGEETAVAAMKAGASDYVMKQNTARLAAVLERELSQAAIRAEHRKGQIELEASRDRYVDLYDFAPVSYLTLSIEGLITQLNLTAAEMLGEVRSSLINTPFSRFVQPADTERWYQHFLRALHEGGKHGLELALQSATGGALHVQLDCMRVTSERSEPTVRVALTDISARKAAEDDLRRFEGQLREVQKMESIGTLAGGIAHDFNNILGAILGNVALARADLDVDHPAQASLAEIFKAGTRARALVQQILTFSRKEAQELVTQSLQPILEETHHLLRATLPARVGLELRLCEAPLFVPVDATQVQQVLMNLCTNAWHALNHGAGHITVGLEALTLDATTAQQLGRLPEGRYAHLWVSDNGSGMDAATRARIFEPFFTTKPVGQGTGLGLSVVHGILSSHHGTVTVESELGRGSTFHMYLPAVEEPAGPTVPAPSVQRKAPSTPTLGRGEHVLYVDDDEIMVLMVEQILQRSGYRVSCFHDAREAVAAVRENPESFDLVVTDFNMPEFSGLDVARELSRIRSQLPVVISSGYITDELRDAAKQAGARSLLEKQNTFEELSELVGGILSQGGAKPGPY